MLKGSKFLPARNAQRLHADRLTGLGGHDKTKRPYRNTLFMRLLLLGHLNKLEFFDIFSDSTAVVTRQKALRYNAATSHLHSHHYCQQKLKSKSSTTISIRSGSLLQNRLKQDAYYSWPLLQPLLSLPTTSITNTTRSTTYSINSSSKFFPPTSFIDRRSYTRSYSTLPKNRSRSLSTWTKDSFNPSTKELLKASLSDLSDFDVEKLKEYCSLLILLSSFPPQPTTTTTTTDTAATTTTAKNDEAQALDLRSPKTIYDAYIQLSRSRLTKYLAKDTFTQTIKLMLLLSKKYRQQNLDILGRIPNWIIRVMDEKRQLGFKQFASFEYACLIEAFSQNPDTEYDAMQLLDPLVDRLESGKDFKDIRLMYHSAMKGFMQYFNIRSVMTIVSKMSQHATKLADAKKYDVVKYVQPDSTTWEMVISLFEERKMRSAMVRTWVGMLSRGEAPTVSIQRSMVKTLALQGRLEEAELVMRIGRVLGVGLHKEDKDQARRQKSLSWELNTKISSLASNLSAINSIVIPLKEPRVFKREDIDSLKVDGPDELGPIDSVIYGILISSAITYKNIQVAKQLFTEMQSEHVITDAKAFSYLANIYLHDQKTNKLQELINEYLSAKNRNNSKTEIQASKVDVEVVHSDIDLIGPLLYFYVESGEIFRAKELLDEWDQSYQDKIPAFELGYALLKIYRAANESKKGLLIFETSISATRRKNTDKGDESEKPKLELRHYVVMLRAAMDIKDLPKCVEILKLMDKNKVLPNQKIMETLLYTFLNAQALDLFDIAYDYIHNVLNMPLSMPLYTKWMKVLANHGDVYGIRNVLNDMDMMGQAPETHHYAILMQTLALCGHHDQAVEVLTQLKDVKSSVRPNADIYIAMIESSVINGQIKEAEQRLGALLEGTLMPPGRIPPRAFNNVMLGYLYHGDGSSAARIYRRMLDVGVKPNAHTYSALMHAYAWEGELETCKQLLNDMITRGVQPDPVIYTIMIVAFSMKADVRGAQRIFQQMCDQRNKWVVYRHIQKSKPGWPLGKHHSEIPTSKFVSDQNNDEDKEEMPPQPFVIDPVVYITMLKLYNNSKNLRKAIDMWSSLLSDYPVLRWNPRTGGQAKLAPTEVTAKTISYTSDFHKSALHILLRTFRASLKVNEIMDNPDKALDYMVNMEINKADTTESDVPLTEKDFWASTSMHGFEKKKSDEQSGLLEPLQIIDAMMRIWQRLEQIKFQFDNVHLNGYLSCLVVTRQYEELIRVLGNSVTTQSRVLTKLPASKNTAKVSKSTTLPPLSFDEDIARPSMPRLTITPQNTYLLLDRFRVDDFIDQHRRKHTPRNGKRRNDSKDPDIDGGQTLYLDFDNQSNRVISGGLLPELSKQEKKWQEETRARVIEMWSKHITIGGLWMLRNKDKL